MIITLHLFDQQKTAVKMQRRICLKLVRSGHSSAKVGAQEVNRCAPLALYRGFRYIQATHIQTLTQEEQRLWSSGPRQVFILQLPQRPLSPAAMRACSALSSLEIHPSFTNSFSLYLEFTSHQAKSFLSLYSNFFLQTSTFLPHASLMSTPGLPLMLLSNSPPVSVYEGPQSSDCSTRMSDSHILTFRQPQGPKGSSSFKQSHPLSTFRKVAQSDCYSWHRWSSAVSLHPCFILSAVRRDCFTAV